MIISVRATLDRRGQGGLFRPHHGPAPVTAPLHSGPKGVRSLSGQCKSQHHSHHSLSSHLILFYLSCCQSGIHIQSIISHYCSLVEGLLLAHFDDICNVSPWTYLTTSPYRFPDLFPTQIFPFILPFFDAHFLFFILNVRLIAQRQPSSKHPLFSASQSK